jgi:uncharacterized protein (UPF0332 family)
LTIGAWMQMADRAITSAQTLLTVGDTDGACNRAYYAMFDAANAALVAAGFEPAAKSHAGLLQMLSLRLIKPGLLPNDLGRSIQRVFALRQSADYHLTPVETEVAQNAVELAKNFVAMIHHFTDERNAPPEETTKLG